MIAKLHGADVRIAAVIANRFNHVYLAAPSITSIKQLKGKKVAVSRFGSGSHFQNNLALKEAGIDPEKDVTVLQIGNSRARITAILSRVVALGTKSAAMIVPSIKAWLSNDPLFTVNDFEVQCILRKNPWRLPISKSNC